MTLYTGSMTTAEKVPLGPYLSVRLTSSGTRSRSSLAWPLRGHVTRFLLRSARRSGEPCARRSSHTRWVLDRNSSRSISRLT